jgi:hypothetical protein
MWAQWLERILNAHDAEAYAGRRAARKAPAPMADAAQDQETSCERAGEGVFAEDRGAPPHAPPRNPSISAT